MLHAKKSEKQFKGYFQNELASHLLPLLHEYGMHKNKKFSLYEALSPLCGIVIGDTVYVVDEGFLIHQVV